MSSIGRCSVNGTVQARRDFEPSAATNSAMMARWQVLPSHCSPTSSVTAPLGEVKRWLALRPGMANQISVPTSSNSSSVPAMKAVGVMPVSSLRLATATTAATG
ncbi:MAG: hypothetical protein IPK28_07385 [Devosia sp.]|nr:hypothetical protein [Devosia sp.]